jgi:hypothetical protein
MRLKLSPATFMVWLVTTLALLGSGGVCAQAADLKFQVLLVWGTDDAKPPEGKNYKPVEPEIRKQIKALKWKNYFEVKRHEFVLSPGSTKKVAISEKCELDLKELGNSSLEVVVIGKGKEVARVKQALRKGEILVPGGEAPNETAWLVILKRLE